MNTITDQKRLAAVAGLIAAVAETIRELDSVPSGYLYAQLMGHMSFESYEAVIGWLVRSGVVRRETSHLLVWTGPVAATDSQSNCVPAAHQGEQLNAHS